jgi:hypothetical protein
MNLNGEEKRIRQLFREMSSEDQKLAPEFGSVVEAASRIGTSRGHAESLRLVAVVALLGLAIVIAAFVLLQPSKPQTIQVRTSPLPEQDKEPNVAKPGPALQPTTPEPHRAVIRRSHKPRSSDSLSIAMKSLSMWRSPTASLLPTPNDELLRTLPRLGESLRMIPRFSPDQFN